ncbi:PH and SEC7 domain-containing protein 3 [Nymphon striatum]|nr:PH and SEC7 domain-containing protein 3 [Nymphon striatum]
MVKDPEIKDKVLKFISECPSPCRSNARKRLHQRTEMTEEKKKEGRFVNKNSETNSKNNNVENRENVPPLNGTSENNVSEPKSPKSKSGPRFEAFMMTGDLIINLNKESSGKSIIPPSMKKVDSLKAVSTPSSPGDRVSHTEQNANTSSKDDTVPRNPDALAFSGLVRTSKSEDHLQKAMLTTVNIDIEDNGLASSSSINNLMDSRPDNDRIVWTYNDPAHSPKISPDIISPNSNHSHSPYSSYSTSPTSPNQKFLWNGPYRDKKNNQYQTENGFSSNDSVYANKFSSDDIMTAHSHVNSSGDEQTEVVLSFNSVPASVEIDKNEVHKHVKNKPKSKKHGYHHRDANSSTDSEETTDDPPYHKLDDETSSSSNGSCGNGGSQQQLSPSSQTDEEVSDIDSLHSYHYSPKAVDMPSASRLAKRLYMLDGFKKSDVSRHLSKNNDFARVVAEEYLSYFDFTGDSLDAALRKFLKQFALTGETQERERVLVHYSKRYLDCNPNTINSQDAVHTLTCALMLLNTDLHGENIPRKMTCAEFIENLSGLNEGDDYPRDMLKRLYHSIKSNPLVWASDDDGTVGELGITPGHEKKEQAIGTNPFLLIPNATNSKEYKKGYVMKKSCVDANGKKTSFGKRGWRMYHATLRDMILYLHKDEQGFKTSQLYDNMHNSIRIHHCLATKASDYTKKQHVFRLQTADLAQYLFQTSDSKELQSWIESINFVAASLSLPPLAGAVGSQKRFQRPLLPVSHTRLNMREQLQNHEQKIMQLEEELEDHNKYPPEKGAKSRVVHDYQEKLAYLQFELTRYKTYAYLIQSKMAKYPDMETSLVETSIKEHDEPTEKSINENSTSPLHVKQSGVPVQKVSIDDKQDEEKSNNRITDRYSYRAAIYTNLEENYV